MKKTLIALMMTATLLTAACKDEDPVMSLAHTQWVGYIENDPELLGYTDGVLVTYAEYTLFFNDEKNGEMGYKMTVLVDGESGEGDNDWAEFTYTFDGTTNGTLTLEDEEVYSFRYDADYNSIVLPLDADSQGELNASEIVFYRVI
ncbi:MAG: hypothetical protein Q4D03_09170 [Bacteroidales bacterium]|nr:hypothetical protein [Bacteroidales bacterium]